MEAARADERFMSMLAEVRVDPDRPDMLATWQVFKAFAAVPLTNTLGGLPFEYGLNVGDFYVHFVRYFYIDDDPFMIDCNFEYGPSPALSGFKTSVQTSLGERLEDQPFFQQAETDAGFWQSVAQQQVTQAVIYIGEQ